MSQSNEANDYKILSVETTAKFPENNIIKLVVNLVHLLYYIYTILFSQKERTYIQGTKVRGFTF